MTPIKHNRILDLVYEYATCELMNKALVWKQLVFEIQKTENEIQKLQDQLSDSYMEILKIRNEL